MKTEWMEVRLRVSPGEADLAASLLAMEGAKAVELREEGPDALLVTAFPSDFPFTEALARVCAALDRLAPEFRWRPAELSTEILQDVDWTEEAKKAFQPFRVSDQLWICPTWNVVQDAGPKIIINPGLAFGTGLHATTRMCLELLCETVRKGHGVWDLGCGTGILAMAGSLLGAARVLATDSDPQALIAAEENLLNNAMASRVTLREADGFQDYSSGPWDIIVSNVTLDFLLSIAESVRSSLSPGGFWIFSGFLLEQESCLQAGLSSLDFERILYRRKDEWGAGLAQVPF